MQDFLCRQLHTGGPRHKRERGQALVEFAMVIPMLVVLFMGLLETALALNASLAVNRASQHGAHIAASAGNILGADCLILDAVEANMGAPNDASRISEVLIERTSMVGNLVYGTQLWRRGGSTECTYPDGSAVEVPYRLTLETYPEGERCTVLGGCPTLGRSTVDNVGVTVRYTHGWVTPLHGALDLLVPGAGGGDGSDEDSGSGGWSFEQRNIFRMEPTL